MEKYIVIYCIVLILIYYIIARAIAEEFYSIAAMKGHNERKYFWWCFFLIPIGALMVIALPDREEVQSIRQPVRQPDQSHYGNPKTVADTQQVSHKWRCPACGKLIDSSPCPYCGQ